MTQPGEPDDYDSPWKEAIERHGIERGRLQMLRENVLEILDTRFGAMPEAVREQVLAIEDLDRLRELHRQAIIVPSLAGFQELLAGTQPGPQAGS